MRTLMLVLLGIVGLHGVASADDLAEAKGHYERAQSAFALAHYADAADEYEKAFALKNDSALLYNAAQAHRLAGNKERALLLYQNYLRMFGREVRRSDRDDVQRHIAELKEAIASDQRAKSSPSNDSAPVAGLSRPSPSVAPAPTMGPPSERPPPAAAPTEAPPSSSPAVAQPAATPSAAPLVASPPPRESRPLTRRPLFWAAVAGAAVVVAGVVALGVVVGSRTADPSPSYGRGTLQ